MSDPQESLFAPPTIPAHQTLGWQRAYAEKAQALRAVEVHGDPEWADLALAAVRKTAERLPEFFVDQVWEHPSMQGTVDDRAMGPVMRKAARFGYCKKTNVLRPSVRSHGSGKPVWRSLIYEGERP